MEENKVIETVDQEEIPMILRKRDERVEKRDIK